MVKKRKKKGRRRREEHTSRAVRYLLRLPSRGHLLLKMLSSHAVSDYDGGMLRPC